MFSTAFPTRTVFRRRLAVLTAGAAMLSVGELPAADDATPALLEARCFKCHGPESQKGDLRLDSRVSALRGGESGENVVVPGKSAESRLIERVTSDDPDHRMPPKGEALPASEVAALRAWIDDIPAWKSAVAALDEVTTEHWSYQPVVKPPVPPSDFPNPIDAFVAAGLAEKSLGFNPPADGRALLRRMHLDVTGLLPDGDEAAAFEADYEMEGADPVHQDAAAAALADRLLESPRFGERWARHWLDVVRFADSSGFETNHERPNAYHYRDYVIRAFNDDKPYDRFVFEQIAGDTVGEDAATGFLVGGPWDRVKGKDPQLNAMQRQDELSDMVNTTGTAFLGVTMICAKCHNHKFDPVSQTDFYGMQAALAGVQHGEREMRGADAAERKARADALAARIDRMREELRDLKPKPYLGRTVFIDDTDPARFEALAPKKGDGKNRDGAGRGHLADPGGPNRLPNVSGGSYSWWENKPDADVAAYRPGVDGKFRLWLSWGCGYLTHSVDVRYVLDRDGDPLTRDDQSAIATVDQQKFGDGTADVGNQPMWSGFYDAGVHEFGPRSALLVRGGKTGTSVSADAIVLQAPDAAGAQPRLRPPVDPAVNEEEFAPVTTRFVRFAIEASSSGQPCLDELEVWTAPAPGQPSRNLAPEGKAVSSGDFPNNSKHRLAHLKDGKYGNDHSWISNEVGKGWVRLEFKEPAAISRVVWGRDRERKYTDRLATTYRVEVAEVAEGPWKTVASSEGRARPGSPAADPVTYDLAGLDPAQAAKARAVWERIAPLEEERAALVAVPMVYAGQFAQPKEPTHRLYRGDPLAPKEVVAPDGLAVFRGLLGSFDLAPDAPEQERRVALANWIVDPRHPLTARVIVNRLWHYHFGRGLVATPSDFGDMGFRPTHPELLDWLAAELVEHGWSLKHIHRLILTSRAYRQSSAPRPEALAADANTEGLWRFPPRRLEAEAIRDNILLVSGALDTRMYGPGFLLFEPNANYSRNWIPQTDGFDPEDYRRMVYSLKLRMENDAIFGAFDCPDAGQVAPARSRSTTPIQALNLFNSGFLLDQSERFAARVRETLAGKGDDDPRKLADAAFEFALGRPCRSDERDDAARLVADHGLPSLCRALFNANEFLFLP